MAAQLPDFISVVLIVSLQNESYQVSEREGGLDVCIVTGNQTVARNVTLMLSTVDGTAIGKQQFPRHSKQSNCQGFQGQIH